MRIAATVSCEDVLHARPIAVLGKMCALFPNTDFQVKRCNPISAEAAKQANPKSLVTMLLACFAEGEELYIETTGDNAELAALVLKAGLENMHWLYDAVDSGAARPQLGARMYDLVCGVLGGFESSASTRLHAEARRHFLEAEGARTEVSSTSYETSTVIADRLHNAIVEILPLVAEHFESALVLCFQCDRETEDLVFDLSNSQGLWPRFSILAYAPPAGTRATIRTSGAEAQACARYVADVLRLLPVVDDWIRSEGVRAETKEEMIEGVLRFVDDCIRKPRDSVVSDGSRHPVLHDVLTPDCIIVTDARVSKEEALRALIALHEEQTGVPAEAVLAQVHLRERHLPCFENGIAIPHARIEAGPLVSLCLGVYKNGVQWIERDRAYVVLLLVTAADAVQTHISYLGQAYRVLGEEEGLRGLLLADSAEAALSAVRIAEARIGSPLPLVANKKVLVIESIADDLTLRRDRMINESPRMQGIHVEYLYACAEKEDGSLEFHASSFARDLRVRIANRNPDFVLLHTGIAFHRYRRALLEAIRMTREQFPQVRFGYQEKQGLDVPPDVFNKDIETVRFQREFFRGLLGGPLSCQSRT
ncbi:MAG: hypothetical protein C4B58_11790 [Deltaproteobacteria bacterium]|nr:MAG: hypothetical protein C4B58_11790 [Deltaproteobacteria bacterium]